MANENTDVAQMAVQKYTRSWLKLRVFKKAMALHGANSNSLEGRFPGLHDALQATVQHKCIALLQTKNGHREGTPPGVIRAHEAPDDSQVQFITRLATLQVGRTKSSGTGIGLTHGIATPSDLPRSGA